MKISNILEKIDENQLFVPAFQREYVWKRDDAKLLIDSLIKEYPTGTMLTWETGSPPELKGPHKYSETQGAVKLILDGQQRITTLYMLIRGEIPPYYSLPEITNDTRGLFVNLETLELSYYMKTRMENDPRWQNITEVFKGTVSAFDLQTKSAESGKEFGMEELKLLNDNINAVTRINDREFPEQIVPVKATIREAIDIFYKVNAGGVALTEAELALAQISGYWPQVRARLKDKLAKLKEDGFVFKLDFIVYVLLGCLYHMGSDMRKLHGKENNDKLQETWDLLENKVLDYVVNLLRSNAYVDHSWEVSSVYALVPIIVYCFDRGGQPLSDIEIKKMTKWFYYSQIRARYVSQTPTKLDRDLRTIAESEQPFDDLLQVIAEENRLEIMPFEFVGRGILHPLWRMMRWYFKSRGAVCLTTGVSLRQNMGEKYKLENDHIFPFSRLKAAGYGRENRIKYSLAQEFTNRAILTQTANRTKSNIKAIDYLKTVKKQFPESLALQSIPEDEHLWELENYEEFIEERRQLLATQLNEFLEGITKTDDVPVPASLEEIILEGESDELEFKSSLRWSFDESQVDKKLEEVIVKSVAAFANAEGGTLLIGVRDDGHILGLNHDYNSLSEADRDKFELHLRTLLNNQLGKAWVTTSLQIKFPELDEKEICKIDITPAKQPVVIKIKDKNGQAHEKFYVRSGNSSQDLSITEMNTYIQDHFS